MNLKMLSDTEIETMEVGTRKIIGELQEETNKDYPKSVKMAIQNELQNRYDWYEALQTEKEKRFHFNSRK